MGSLGTTSATRRGKSAFEHNLLPGFAEWAIEEIERRRPDYLIPAETKGARVLDAALAFAREELGARISIPVIYGSALAYLPPETLRSARVMVVDDAVRSGSNLRRHSDQISAHGVAEIDAIVCVGCSFEGERRPDVACYLEVEEKLYQRYAWQLTESVVARGLPPEVDHFLLELKLQERLPDGWAKLAELLSRHGTLTVDGPEHRRDELQPMTLHFPRLPGAVAANEISDGAYKLRFFADPENDRVLVVPIFLSSLTLGGVAPGERVSRAHAQEVVAAELGGLSPIAEQLLAGMQTPDPRTLFRALSVCREVEMAAGLARLLSSERAASLRVQADVFERLFGARVGSAVGAHVASEISAGLEQAETSSDALGPAEPPLFLDGDVATATNGIAQDLKRLYDQEADAPAHDPPDLVGLPMRKVAAELPGEDPLLASRCVDFGLALTTLVPYIAETPTGDGTALHIERRYRVSENNRGHERPYVSLDTIRGEKSEEALALICRRVQERWEAYRDSPVPVAVLAPLVGVMQPLVLAGQRIALKASPVAEEDGVELILLDTVEQVRIDETTSGRFSVEPGGVEPKPDFERIYRAQELWLDFDECTETIENGLDLVIDLLSRAGVEGRSDLLECWALCTDRRLGLSHVRFSLDAALRILRRPLSLIQGGGEHERSRGLDELVRPALDAAARKLELLRTDWSEPARTAIPAPSGRSEERLMSSLGAPREAEELYGMAGSLVSLLGALAELVERLDAASFAAGHGEAGEVERRVAQEAHTWSARVRQALVSLGEEEPRAAKVASEPRLAIADAAVELLDLLELIGAFAAALSGSYCGQRGARLAPPNAEDARHAAILSLDLTGATPRAESARNARANKQWVGEGLNLGAQWTRAFGGYEFSDRKGDELTVEFADGDGAALAGAAVLVHTAALRSSGVDELRWEFHTGVDCGEIDDDDGSNVIGSPVNRAVKLAKNADAQAQGRYVPIADEGARHCSASLRTEPLSTGGEEVLLGEIRLQPTLLDSREAIRSVTSRVQAAAERMSDELPALEEIEAPLQTEPEGAGRGGDLTGEAALG